MRLISGGQQNAGLPQRQSAGAYAEQSAGVLVGILESADELFAALDADLCFIAFNAAFRRDFSDLFGHVPILGQSLWKGLARFPDHHLATALAQRALAGEAFKVDQEFALHGAPQKVYTINVTPALNPEGRAVVIAFVARDITEERKAERKFRQLLEASPDAMLIVREGVIEHINSQAESLFGYARDALLGKPLEILLPAHLHEQHILQRAAYAQSPRTRPMGNGMSLSGLRADGTEFPLEISLSPLSVAGNTVVAAAIRDVSGRKKTEDALRQENAALRDVLATREDQLACLHQQLQEQIETAEVREQALLLSTEQVRAVFENSIIGIAMLQLDGHFIDVNPCLCSITGYTKEQLLQQKMGDITHPDDVRADVMRDAQMLSGAINSYMLEKRFYRQDGGLIWVSLAASLKRDEQGVPQYFVIVIEDITSRKLTEQKLGEATMRLQMSVDMAQLGFWEWNPNTNAAYLSPEWKRQLGYADEAMPAMYDEWKSRLHPDDRDRVLHSLKAFIAKPEGQHQAEYRLRHRDGRYRWFLSRAIAIEDPPGKMKKILGIRADITEHKETEWRIHQAAHHDSLTGLPTRALLYEFADHLLAVARRNQTHGAMLFIDLDRFKEINDQHGHEAGDAVLREVGKRLLASIRKGDIAGRLGGDEFLVILPQVADALRVGAIAEHILTRLKQPHSFKELQLTVTPSIGVAIFPKDGSDPDTLVRHADHAMYVAKDKGRGRVQFYTTELARRADAVGAFESRLSVALKHGELELYLQPIVNSRSAKVLGAEALLRWRRRPDEIVLPNEFIPIAEATGLISDFGEWVIRAALVQLRECQRAGLPPILVSINISPVQFRHNNFVKSLAALIGEYGVTPTLLQVELRESTVTQDIDRTIVILHQLKALGVRIALDNFGTGGCGIGALSRMPLDTLKIDPSFVCHLDRDGYSKTVTQAAIGLGRMLHLDIVADGIESAQALAYVRERHCEQVQGFHVSEPMPASVFQGWYRDRVQQD